MIIIVLLVGCGNSSKFEGQYSGEDLKAVLITEKSLPRGAKIEDCKVVRGKLPLALMESEYKSIRDKVNKTRLDYRSCLTRGLDAAAQKNAKALADIQTLIQEKSISLASTSPEYLFVLANVEERGASNRGPVGYITVFDPESMEKVDMMQVTRPLYNNAVMVTEAINGALSDPVATTDAASLKCDNPVVEFILGCNPK